MARILVFLLVGVWVSGGWANTIGGADDRHARHAGLALARGFDNRLDPDQWRKMAEGARARFLQAGPQRYLLVLAEQPQTGARLSERQIAREQAALEAQWPAGTVTVVRRYRHLPLLQVELLDKARLSDLLASQPLLRMHAERFFHPFVAQSLPLIGQTQAAATGVDGEGVALAVVDTGIDYTRVPFNCTALAGDDNCQVKAVFEAAADDGRLDAQGHGTAVAATAAAVAPGSAIVGVDVFGDEGASTSDMLAGIDWILAHRAQYEIAVVNFSLGSAQLFEHACDAEGGALLMGFNALRSHGILAVAASGNNGSASAMALPACFSNALSVGASYDDRFSFQTSQCSDPQARVDEVACFSNTAAHLDLLAPGARIAVAGVQRSGTSYAAPHVAGAAAVAQAHFPDLARSELADRLRRSDYAVVDPRSGLSFPRLDLTRALQPANDQWAEAEKLDWSHSRHANTLFATTESGEPGGYSGTLWYRLTAPATRTVKLAFSSSGAAELNVYRGRSLRSLTQLARIVPGESLTVLLQASEAYHLQVGSATEGQRFAIELLASTDSDETIPLLPPWAGLLLVGALLRLRRCRAA